MRAAECARAGAESKLVVPVLLDLGLGVVAVTLPLVVAARAALAVAARAVGLGDAALVAHEPLLPVQVPAGRAVPVAGLRPPALGAALAPVAVVAAALAARGHGLALAAAVALVAPREVHVRAVRARPVAVAPGAAAAAAAAAAVAAAAAAAVAVRVAARAAVAVAVAVAVVAAAAAAVVPRRERALALALALARRRRRRAALERLDEHRVAGQVRRLAHALNPARRGVAERLPLPRVVAHFWPKRSAPAAPLAAKEVVQGARDRLRRASARRAGAALPEASPATASVAPPTPLPRPRGVANSSACFLCYTRRHGRGALSGRPRRAPRRPCRRRCTS